MRTFILALLATIIAAPVYAQALGTGIPLNQDKEVSPEQAEKRRQDDRKAHVAEAVTRGFIQAAQAV